MRISDQIDPSEYLGSLHVDVQMNVQAVLVALTSELDYPELIAFVRALDEEVADSVFTDDLKRMVQAL